MGPVGHSLTGLSAYWAYSAAAGSRPSWIVAGAAVVLANSPDLDLVPAFWVGFPQANLYHHSYSHTFAFALAAGCLVAVLMAFRQRRLAWVPFVFGFGMTALHVIGDYFTRDTGFPYGEMLWWPVSNIYHLGPSMFLDIHKASWTTLFSSANLKASIHELLIFTPLMSWITVHFYLEDRMPVWRWP